MYHSKVDANQPAILKGLKKLGISYKPVHQIKGFADICVGHNGLTYIFEIKPDKSKRLTPKEQEFANGWNGQYKIVYSLEDILEAISYEL